MRLILHNSVPTKHYGSKYDAILAKAESLPSGKCYELAGAGNPRSVYSSLNARIRRNKRHVKVFIRGGRILLASRK